MRVFNKYIAIVVYCYSSIIVVPSRCWFWYTFVLCPFLNEEYNILLHFSKLLILNVFL